jgi:hypothetical protein
MITAARIRATAVLLAGAIITAACADVGDQSAATTPIAPGSTLVAPATALPAPETASPVSERGAPVSVSTPRPSTSPDVPIVFPPPDLPLVVSSELDVGVPDLLALKHGGEWLFGMGTPSTLVRIDPVTGVVDALDLGLGESIEGAAGHAYVGDSVWVLGGPFRDTLVEVDAATMVEILRIRLDDDHGIRQQLPSDELWLTTLKAVRRVDVDAGAVDPPVELEVDPSAGALVAHGGAVWVPLPSAARVARIDTTTGEVTTIDTEPGPGSITAADGTIWVAHSPTASVSRIDAPTGKVVGVTDVDIAGDVASVSAVPAIQATADAVWVIVRFAGSPFRDAIVRLDPVTGQIDGSRTIPFPSNTWEARDGELWVHRANRGSLIAVDVDGFSDAPATWISDLLPVGSAPTTAPTPNAGSPADASLADAFERLTDPTVPAAELGLGELAPVRDEMLALLGAQPGGELRIVELDLDEDNAVVLFDVVVEGDVSIMPGLEFVFERASSDERWVVSAESFCDVADGVGLACP